MINTGIDLNRISVNGIVKNMFFNKITIIKRRPKEL